ncbi:hypothetical protein GCM10025867_50920 (plasmid) [Frondihabitans sucicola]|uniref:Lipoprotein n=1 Tax=Frondihabitans sucicola TaxID=1268041 RepID=A0ABM8GWI0_9MICO|nr:hypothetical protein [Frondihabitans sucicola]BDZ52851.1 hypothetical protein GCM10025867_50920 [Frondihabitans sucicola]
MKFRTITAAAALITVGALALTGCSSTGAKTAAPKSTSAASAPKPAATKDAPAVSGAWMLATVDSSTYTRLNIYDPATGSFKNIGEIETNGGHYPIEYLSGDGQYWIPADDVDDETAINFIKVGDDKAYSDPIDIVSTMPGFGPSTKIESIGFDLDTPHTLVVDATMDDSGDVTAWGYDVTKPTQAPEKLTVATYNDGRLDIDNVTALPAFPKATGQKDEDGDDVYADIPENYVYPWMTADDDGYDPNLPSGTDAAVHTKDGAQWAFSTRHSDTDTTLFVSKRASGGSTYDTVGKPLQQLPSGTDIAWARPLGK